MQRTRVSHLVRGEILAGIQVCSQNFVSHEPALILYTLTLVSPYCSSYAFPKELTLGEFVFNIQ